MERPGPHSGARPGVDDALATEAGQRHRGRPGTDCAARPCPRATRLRDSKDDAVLHWRVKGLRGR
ncbi:hypothetical protein QJS66_23690 (plasmid) [Kocuria rhizophila]|nr:hypothetical protein QJS66_23690 [Kocuria rhizophila]